MDSIHPDTPDSLTAPSAFDTFSLFHTNTGTDTAINGNSQVKWKKSRSRDLMGQNHRFTFHTLAQHHQWQVDESDEINGNENTKSRYVRDDEKGRKNHQSSHQTDDTTVVTFTTGESFLSLPRWDTNSRQNISIKIKFRTSEPNGVVVYSNGIKNIDSHTHENVYTSNDNSQVSSRKLRPHVNSDFFAIELLDGLVFLVLNMGTGAVKVKSTLRRVDNGHWHEVSVHLSGRNGLVSVDGRNVSFVAPLTPPSSMNRGDTSSSSSFPRLDLEGPLFLGSLGSPGVITRGSSHQHSNTLLAPPEIWSGSLGYGFIGCVRDVIINDGDTINLAKFVHEQDSSGVQLNCTHISSSHCTSDSCVNSASCVEGWNRPVCQCHTLGYTGVNCARKSLTLAFDSGDFVRINLPSMSITQAEDVYLRFRTLESSGLLVLATDTSHQADIYLPSYLVILLEMGKLKVIINLGEGNKATYVSTSQEEVDSLADDNWHSVKIERRGPSLEVRVDSINLVTELTGQRNTLFIDSLFIGSVGSSEKSTSKSVSRAKNQRVNKQQHQQQQQQQQQLSTNVHRHSHHGSRNSHHSLLSNMDSVLQATLKDVPSFTGFVESFIFNGVDLLESSRTGQVTGLLNSPVQFNLKQNVLTDDHISQQAQHFHHTVTFKSRKTSITLAGLKAYSQMKIHFQFKTVSQNGLILFNEGKSSNHFIAIELDAGRLAYLFNLGDGGRRLFSNLSNLSDNKWHSVTVVRSISNLHTLTVDDSLVSMESTGLNTHHILNETAFLGGVPPDMYKSSSSLPKLLKSRHGFEGCLAQIELNGELVDPTVTGGLVLATSTLVQPGCHYRPLSASEKRCTLYACSSVGTCVVSASPPTAVKATGISSPSPVINGASSNIRSACDCDEATFAGPTCTLPGVAVRFVQPNYPSDDEEKKDQEKEIDNKKGARVSMISYFIKDSAQVNRKEDSIEFGLVTRQADSVIVRIDSSVSSDFIEIQVRDGCIAIVYNLGYEDHEITNPHVKVNDEAYHSIRFNRSGANSTLEIDNHNVIERKPAGRHLVEFNFMAQVQIGGKKSVASPFPPITLDLPLDESRSNATRFLPNFTGIIIGLTLNGEKVLDKSAFLLAAVSTVAPSSSSSPSAATSSPPQSDFTATKEGHVHFLTNVPSMFNPSDLNFLLTNVSSSPSPISSSSRNIQESQSLGNVKVHHFASSLFPPSHHNRRNGMSSHVHDKLIHRYSSPPYETKSESELVSGEVSSTHATDDLILSSDLTASCWSDSDCFNFISSLPIGVSNSDDLISPFVTRVTDTSQLTVDRDAYPVSESPPHSATSAVTERPILPSSSSPRPCSDDEDEDCYEEIGSGDRINQEEGDDEDDDERLQEANERAKASASTSPASATSTLQPPINEFYEFKPWITSTVYSVTTSGVEVGKVIRPHQHHQVSTIEPREVEQTYRPTIQSASSSRWPSASKPILSKTGSIVDVPKPPERRKNKTTAPPAISENSFKNPSVKPVTSTSFTSVDRTALVIGIIASIIIIIVFVAPIILFTKIRMIDPSMTGTYFFTHSAPASGDATYNSAVNNGNGSLTACTAVPSSSFTCKNGAVSSPYHQVIQQQQQASPSVHGQLNSSGTATMAATLSPAHHSHSHSHIISPSSIDLQNASSQTHQQPSPQTFSPSSYHQPCQPASILKKTKKNGKEFEWFV